MHRNGKRVLFIVTSHGALGDTGRGTGLYLSELVEPATILRQEGVQVQVASPRGGDAPIDPGSRDARLDSALARDTRPAAAVEDDYDACVAVGGRGALFDLRADEHVARLFRAAQARGRIVAAIGQGACALLDLVGPDGQPWVRGRRLTATTESEERETGLEAALPFSLERELRDRGALFEGAPVWTMQVATEGRHFVTGQNPVSAPAVARAIASFLRGNE
jgi:putative intracellular protease/amidase